MIVIAPMIMMEKVLDLLKNEISFFQPKGDIKHCKSWKGKFFEDGQTLQCYSIDGLNEKQCYIGMNLNSNSIVTLMLSVSGFYKDMITADPHNSKVPVIKCGEWL